MRLTASMALTEARKWVGYHEKASNDQLDSFSGNAGSNNWNRFARDLDALGDFYNGPKNIGPEGYWCDIWFDDVIYYASGKDKEKTLYVLCQPLKSAGAGCAFSAQYYQQAGRWMTTPQPGAQIFFRSGGVTYGHTGIVEEVKGGIVYTIEGNSADMVARRSYAITDPRIVGYGLPRYDAEDAADPVPDPGTAEAPKNKTCTLELPMLLEGDESCYVRAAQLLLIGAGFYCGGKIVGGHEIADGEFGPKTREAVAQFQRGAGLPGTGDIDTGTWDALHRV